MRYFDPRFLLPVAAATVWAQEPAPPAADVEAALRSRVEQFYQLQVDKKFRQAEALVAEDSKDDYYNRAKPDIKGFSIQKIEWLENNAHARVTLRAKMTIKVAQLADQVFDLPVTGFWKMENGQWDWYIDRDLSGQTPFGRMAPPAANAKGPAERPPVKMDVATLMNQVTLDGASVTLSAANPVQTITLSNNMPGVVNLALTDPKLEGISIEVERSSLNAGEKSAIRFRRTGDAKSSGVVRVVAAPLNKVFEIRVRSN
jgi:hypothetical protein